MMRLPHTEESMVMHQQAMLMHDEIWVLDRLTVVQVSSFDEW